MKITEICKGTYSFEEEEGRFFLLLGKEKALLIDSGSGNENVKELISEYTTLPLECAYTRVSIDNMGEVDEFPYFYLSPSDSFLFYNIYHKKGIIRPLFDKDIISLGERDLKVISFPGISPGSVLFLDSYSGILFPGDSISSSLSFIKPFGDINIYVQGIKRLKTLSPYFDVIYPSNGREELSNSIINDIEELCNSIIRHEVVEENGIYKGKNVSIKIGEYDEK